MTTILVIEDTKDIREMMITSLKMHDYDVISASNGSDGVYAAEEHQPDLIICDIMLPIFSGYEVFKRLHASNILPETPFIFATALDRREDIEYGRLMGADDYIVKPFAIADFIKTVQDVLTRREIVRSVDSSKNDNHIFMSYSHADSSQMRSLRDKLREANFIVWTDEQIEPGDEWELVLARMISKSTCVLCLLSENAAQSKWVGREIAYAEHSGTRILPVLVHGEERDSIPLRLINHQFIDMRTQYDTAFERLCAVLNQHLANSL
ncbi:MAG: TIR domain-containing protein [Chloroflexota bacterium]